MGTFNAQQRASPLLYVVLNVRSITLDSNTLREMQEKESVIKKQLQELNYEIMSPEEFKVWNHNFVLAVFEFKHKQSAYLLSVKANNAAKKVMGGGK